MQDELSPSQAAARIGTTTRSVQRWIATGRLPARRVGGRWRVASDALDAFIGQPTVETSAVEGSSDPIRSLFVANRGEIALRIESTCRRLGIRAIIPGREEAPALDLLDIEGVVRAAASAGADAVHPGYGFLAENADAAEAVEAAGMRWVGPLAGSIRAVGDKAAARRLAHSLGIPTVPGYDGPDQADADMGRAARRIGLPLIVKPAAGGGGKGMHVVRRPRDLPGAVAVARREAQSSFGDDRLVLERYLDGPRHVEVQVLFDGHGAGVHLGERECSLQRRHQKIVEETPSPTVDESLRDRMTAAALRLASAVGYRNAGTCEFLVDDGGAFFFLEMNTRLQVEHPVTEAVTGRDLVADQLAIAAGATLGAIGLDQAIVDEARSQGGHAIEVRLYAEDPDEGFLPATGRVEALHWPAGASRFETAPVRGVRVDGGIVEGSIVDDRFDPMLAKIIVHSDDRTTAVDRLTRALGETVILGLTTNLRFLRWLVRSDTFVAGETRTDTIDRSWPPAGATAPPPIPDTAWAAAADALREPAGSTDPFTGSWRLNGPPALRLASEGTIRTVVPRPGPYTVVRVGSIVHLDVDGRSTPFHLAPAPSRSGVAGRAAAEEGRSTVVVAPMPGVVLRLDVAPGATVATGDPIGILEAMKMEHIVVAPGGGRVADVLVAIGDHVTRGQPIATIEPAGGTLSGDGPDHGERR
ncbi:MAG: biotin carboxylase N-terminal domain-containing protein [Candidatus Limnocylindrales bacterium]